MKPGYETSAAAQPAPSTRPRSRDGNGGRHRDPVVTVALEQRRLRTPTADQQPVGARFHRDPELPELLVHGSDPIALLHPQLGRVADVGDAVGERGRDREHRNLILH